MENPVISIIVTVYNHERYIERCLRSIAMQECEYPFEVFIGEDCSPDNTRAVMKRIEPEFPGNFHFLYREHNLGDDNNTDLLRRCTGKYLAICEGDDFWTDKRKLQNQVSFLEGHPDYIACFHHCTVVGEDSLPNGEKYPDCLKDDYSFKEFFYCTMPGQTASFMVRRVKYETEKKKFLACKQFDRYPEDRRNAFILLANGKVKVFQETWSAYRHVVTGGTSYSSRVKVNEAYARNEVMFGKTLMDYSEIVHNDEAYRAARRFYYRVLLKWSVGSVRIYPLSHSLLEVLRQRDAITLLLGVVQWYAVLGMRSFLGRGVTL